MNPSQKETGGSLDRSIAAVVAGQATGTGRRGRKSAETRLRLFRCALKLFAERGFPSVTVEEITEAADVGKGTFFNYFETKDHVLGVMAEIQVARILGCAAAIAQGERPVRSVLRGLALELAEEPGRSPELARAAISAFLASAVVRELVSGRMVAGRRAIAEYVEQGQRRGEIDARLNKEAVAVQFQQALMGTMLLWSLDGQPSLAARVEESFEHFWRAVASASGGRA